MAKLLNILILVCLTALIVCDDPLKQQSNAEATFWPKDFISGLFNSLTESLKNPIGPNVNPNNRCVWKICSKPLKGHKRTESYKDISRNENIIMTMKKGHTKFAIKRTKD